MTIVSPHTMQPVSSERPELPEPTPAVEQNPEEQAKALAARYKVAPGKIVVARQKVSKFWNDALKLEMTEERHELVQTYEPWATILLVGDAYVTDFGTVVQPDPEWTAGRKVLMAATGATDVDLKAGEVEMTVSLVGFRAIHLVDRGDV